MGSANDVTTDREALSTLEGLRRAVATVLGADLEDLEADEDLIGVGLDSIGIMQMSNRLRAAGLPVATADLMSAPTLGEWLALARDAVLSDEPQVDETNLTDSGADEPSAEGWPLTPMQHAYWVGRLGNHPLAVPSHFYWELAGRDLDATRLETAVRVLFDRHPMLRARFLPDGRQEVLPVTPWQGVTLHDLTDESQLGALREEEGNRSLAVSEGEVLDVRLSRLPDGRTFLHINIDMLVSDAASFRVVLEELARLYADPGTVLTPLNYDVARYQRDTARELESDRPAAAAHWRSRLSELPGPPQLPLAVDPAAVEHPRYAKREVWLAEAEVAVLGQRCREHRTTVSMALATAFSQVLSRWSAEPRFLLSMPTFDRRPVHESVPLLVGDFTSLFLLAVEDQDAAGFAARARALQSRLREDLGHGAYSGVDVLRDLARRGGGGTMPVAPVVFTSVLGMGDLVGERVREVFGPVSWISSQTPQVWLDHQAIETGGRILLNWDTVDALFPSGCLDAMFEAYTGIVQWLVDPATDWADPPPDLLPVEQRRTRERVNDTAIPVTGARLHDAFVEQARERPDAVALGWGLSDRLTYGELLAAAQHVARQLGAAGMAGEPVAIRMPRGPRQVVAVLGTLLAGGSYVPIGYSTPVARRDRILQVSGTAVLLYADDLDVPQDLPPGVRPMPVGLAPPSPRGGPLFEPVGTGGLAYTIFTSGSTGRPKGVMVSHTAAVTSVEALNERCGLGPRDRLLAVSALDFDLSVYDIFGPLSVGGAVVLVEESTHGDPEHWRDQVRTWGITVWQSVPTLLEMVLATDGDLGTSLRLALVGGDWPSLGLLPRLRDRVRTCRLVALGGATETTIYSTWFEVEELRPTWRSVPLGTPLPNEMCRVVDSLGRDCPDWVPGELVIGGSGVAEGYQGDPELTARHFVTEGRTRWYRTGDLACYHPDGNLEFLGRRDHQLKIRGHRIELGDVEASFLRCTGVESAVAVGLGEPRDLRLGVTVTVSADAAPGIESRLRDHLTADLPPAMVPETIVLVDRQPLTPNGKVDRAAAARAVADAGSAGGKPQTPANATEEAIARIWEDLLGVEPDRHQNFFVLGGDSLSATRFVQQCRRALGVEVPMQQLFDTPTVAGLAAALPARARVGEHAGSDLIEEGSL